MFQNNDIVLPKHAMSSASRFGLRPRAHPAGVASRADLPAPRLISTEGTPPVHGLYQKVQSGGHPMLALMMTIVWAAMMHYNIE